MTEKDKQSNNLKKKMSSMGNGDKNGKKPFNFYWIYVIIGVVLISLNLFNWNGTMTDITPSEFEQMVNDGDVDRIVVYNKQMAEVFLSEAALSKEKHTKQIKKPLIAGAQNSGPHYKFDIGPADSFQEKLDRWSRDYDLDYDYKTRSDWGSELFTWILFIGIMVAVWMFVMRRISGGGGAGGQVPPLPARVDQEVGRALQGHHRMRVRAAPPRL